MDLFLLLAVLAFLLVSFVLEKAPVDVTAFIALGLLLLFDLTTPEQAVSGFANPAVITVMMMFILSEALVQSGAVARIGYFITNLSRASGNGAVRTLLGSTALVSGFINNTAAVSVFLPVALSLSKHFRISASKLLIPLSYAAVFGGMCTLIGTSTNILVSTLAAERGMAPFAMFEFLWLGGILLVIGTVFNFWIVPRLLPDRTSATDLTGKYQMGSYLTELRVAPDSDLIGHTLIEEDVHRRYRVSVCEILREDRALAEGIGHERIRENDVLIVIARMDDIVAFKAQRKLLLLTDVKLGDEELADKTNMLMEVQLSPRSDVLGATLKDLDFRSRYGCFVLALNRIGDVIRHKLAHVPLQAWDTLLVFGPRERCEALGAGRDMIPLQELPLRLRLAPRWWIGALTIPLVVTLSALGVMPILKSAILGVALLLATRTLRIHQAYEAVDWTVIFLLAALLPVGLAMEETGLAAIIGAGIVQVGEPFGPWVVLSLVILTTSLLTESITNNSAAVLMVPISFVVAGRLGVDPKPFMMGVAFAASMSFATPTGYQTNTMVYGPGGYRFTDYLRVGIPLNVLCWIVASLLIPLIWRF